MRNVLLRLLATSLALLAVGLGQLPVLHGLFMEPGLAPELGAMLNLTMLGLSPFITATLVVELVALVVPRWRSLRLSGFAGRKKLATAALALTLVFALVQSYGVAFYSQSQLLVGPGLGTLIAIVATGVIGAFFLIGLAHVLTRFALGNGFALLLATAAGASVWTVWPQALGVAALCGLVLGAVQGQRTLERLRAKLPSLTFRLPWPMGVTLAVTLPTLLLVSTWMRWFDPFQALVFGLLGALALFQMRRGETGRGEADRPPSELRLPWPTSGLIPFVWASSIYGFPGTFPRGDLTLHRVPGVGSISLFYCFTLLVVVIPLSWLFVRPDRVIRVWERISSQTCTSDIWRQLGERLALNWLAALAALALYVLAIGVTNHHRPAYIGTVTLVADIVSLLLVVATVTDIVAEARHRLRHGHLVSAWPVHRVYAVQPALLALQRAGIPAFARSYHFRKLFHFFGAHVPVDVLVPPAQGEAAHKVLSELLVTRP